MTIYKLFISPNVNYGDVINDQTFNMSFQQKMETILYNVALATTCAIRGSSREKLYQELGLEALQQHRWFKKTLLFLQNTKITVSKVPLFSYQKQPTRGVLCKKVFLEISQNSQENTCARVFFLIKLQV